MKKGDYVVTTTEFRGVLFFGKLAEYNGDELQHGKPITLEECQMCLHWSKKMRGVMGLAAWGPDEECRISPIVGEVIITKVTGIISASDDAAKRWKEQALKEQP